MSPLRASVTVHPDRAILAGGPAGFLKQLDVDVVGQGRQRHPGILLASSAIPASFVEMLIELDVVAIFPPLGSLPLVPPSLHRVLVGRVPGLRRYYKAPQLLIATPLRGPGR